MIRMATINDIDSLVKLRISLLNEAKNNIENYDWDEYSQTLITDMYTIPEYRNKGLGNKLLNDIMKYSKNLGYTKVNLNATDAGRRLYEKYGFKYVTGEMSYKFI